VFAVSVVVHANFSGDRKAGRNGQSEIAHFGEVGALAAKQVFHLCFALGLPITKGVDPLGHQSRPLNSAQGCATSVPALPGAAAATYNDPKCASLGAAGRTGGPSCNQNPSSRRWEPSSA